MRLKTSSMQPQQATSPLITIITASLCQVVVAMVVVVAERISQLAMYGKVKLKVTACTLHVSGPNVS